MNGEVHCTTRAQLNTLSELAADLEAETTGGLGPPSVHSRSHALSE
jgi:hypothetical protein